MSAFEENEPMPTAGRPRGARTVSFLLPAVVFAVICLTFWLLRIYYWRSNSEAPFSDMADYVEAADNILRSFTFGHPRNLTTLTPITPSLIAIAKLISPTQFHSVF